MPVQNTLVLTTKRSLNLLNPQNLNITKYQFCILSLIVTISLMFILGAAKFGIVTLIFGAAALVLQKAISNLFYYLNLDFNFGDIIADLENE